MKNKKILIALIFILSLLIGARFLIPEKTLDNLPYISTQLEKIDVPTLQSPNDQDGDGIDDYTDIVESARAQIGVIKGYDVSYYSGGYPPENTGACTDVLWRALEGAGYDLKTMIDEDMQNNGHLYPKEHDPNINFRRTQNVEVFLERHIESLTTEVIPGDAENLSQWQGGDIVTFAQIPGGLWHTAIVSDKRRRDGVPLLIHNHGRGVLENDFLLDWPAQITGHFRWDLK